MISIHAPRGGSDWPSPPRCYHGYISIHAPRGGSDLQFHPHKSGPFNISIHAPRGGSDQRLRRSRRLPGYFNPRSPWGERRHLRCSRRTGPGFQSTLPVGGATSVHPLPRRRACNFNPRSPWGERLGFCKIFDTIIQISIHAPRGGSDGYRQK